MRVFLLTLGTRGDLELFLALGGELRRRGHTVVLGTSRFFADRVEAAGLGFAPIGEGTHEQLLALLGSLVDVADPWQRVRLIAQQWIQPQLASASAQIGRAGLMSDYFASNLKIALDRGGATLPGALVTYDPPAALTDLDRYATGAQPGRLLDLVGMSRPLVDPAQRWPRRFHFTGFWQKSESRERKADPALEQFMAAGDPPIVMTMGSMVTFSGERLLRTLEEALRIAGRRALVVGGWGAAVPVASDLVLQVPEADYGSLLPRAACVVFHGGTGTVNAVLRSGRPSVVLPQIGPQVLYGRLLLDAGVAAASLDTRTLDAKTLAAAIDRAASDPAISDNATRWRDIVRAEPGVTAAVDAIEQHWTRIVRGEGATS
jgi:UDP:flavonoid glycosyltransferase YjiC (YdhE family)